MNYISTHSLSHEEWLRERKKGIGGSDCAAVLGFSRYRTPVDVWLDKTNPNDLSTWENTSMKIGILAEQNLIKPMFMEQEDKRVLADKKIRIHPEHNFLRANLDGIITDTGDGLGTGVWEAKSTSSRVINSVDGDYPPEYFLQCQHNMMVTGFKYAWLSIWVKDTDTFMHYYIPRDEALIEQIMAKEIEFWRVYVKGNVVPPPVNDSDLKQIYKESVTEPVEATDEVIEKYGQLLELTEKKKAIEEEIESLQFSIKEYMKDREVLTYNGEKVVSYKTSYRFNEALAKEKHPDEYEKYCKKFDPSLLRKKNPSLYDACKVPASRTFRLTTTKITEDAQ